MENKYAFNIEDKVIAVSNYFNEFGKMGTVKDRRPAGDEYLVPMYLVEFIPYVGGFELGETAPGRGVYIGEDQLIPLHVYEEAISKVVETAKDCEVTEEELKMLILELSRKGN